MLEKITALLLPARTWLDTTGGAGTAFGVLTVFIFLTMYALRKWAPTAKLWERVANVIPALDFDMTPGLAFLRKTWQGLFPTLVSAIVGALASGGSVKVAAIAALAGPITVFGHEFAKWLPFLPYTGQTHPAASSLPVTKRDSDDDDDGTPPAPNASPVASSRPLSAPPSASASAFRFAAVAVAALAILTACAALTPQDKASVKTFSTIAQDLCVIAHSEQHAELAPGDVLKSFCSTDEQLAPFVDQLLAAKHAAMAPPEEAKKAPKLTGCPAAVDRAKALQCPVDDPDAGGWCSSRSKTEVDCMSAAKSCLAFTRCTEVSK